MKVTILTICLFLTQHAFAGPLHNAVLGNDEAKITAQIKKGEYINEIDNEGSWPLLIAATYGNINAAKVLLEHGADVNRANNHGYTALHEAASMANRKLVLLLLKNNAEINKRDVNSNTALTYAELSGSPKLVRMLKRKGAVK